MAPVLFESKSPWSSQTSRLVSSYKSTHGANIQDTISAPNLLTLASPYDSPEEAYVLYHTAVCMTEAARYADSHLLAFGMLALRESVSASIPETNIAEMLR